MTPLTLSYHDADFDKTRYIIVSTPNGIQMLELCDQDPAIDGHTHLLNEILVYTWWGWAPRWRYPAPPLLSSSRYARARMGNLWLPRFPAYSTTLSTVESHCLLCIPTMLRFSRTLANVMEECFANGILQWCGIEVTKMAMFSYHVVVSVWYTVFASCAQSESKAHI